MSDPKLSPRQRERWLAAVLLATLIGSFAFLSFGPGFSTEYAGWGALMALPFCVGALMVMTTGEYSPLGCLIAPIALFALCWVLIALGLEGIACVAMVLPFWIVLGLGGGLVALVRRKYGDPNEEDGSARLKTVGLMVFPLVAIWIDGAMPAQWREYSVVRSVSIDAAPEQVWPRLVSIPDIRPSEGIGNPTHDLFDIPRPSGASLVNRQGTLVRKANWGTDVRFEEIVTAMNPRETLEWRFSFTDDSIQRHTDRHIAPDGAMVKIERGRYDLQDLGNGRSRLTLTTTYRMRTRMSWYFAWWGERFLGDVQENILTIVRDRSQTNGNR